MVPGLAVGAVVGVALYFVTVWALPQVSNAINLITK
jgi:hypothetical protein